MQQVIFDGKRQRKCIFSLDSLSSLQTNFIISTIFYYYFVSKNENFENFRNFWYFFISHELEERQKNCSNPGLHYALANLHKIKSLWKTGFTSKPLSFSLQLLPVEFLPWVLSYFCAEFLLFFGNLCYKIKPVVCVTEVPKSTRVRAQR